mgnify:CR=1 FL=1
MENGKIATTIESLSTEGKLAVLNQKRIMYLQSQYDAEIEYRIADRLQDEPAKKAQMDRLKRLEQALELIDEELATCGG